MSSLIRQAEAEIAAADAFGGLFAAKDTIDIDDGIIGVIGANIEGKVSKQVSLFAGLGYQLDLVKGGTTFMGEDLEDDNELKALLVRAGNCHQTLIGKDQRKRVAGSD